MEFNERDSLHAHTFAFDLGCRDEQRRRRHHRSSTTTFLSASSSPFAFSRLCRGWMLCRRSNDAIIIIIRHYRKKKKVIRVDDVPKRDGRVDPLGQTHARPGSTGRCGDVRASRRAAE